MSSNGTLALSGTALIGAGTVTDAGHLTTSNSSTALSSITMASGSALNLGNFTVQPGATLSVSAGASVTIGPEPANGGTQTLADNGTLTFAAGDVVTLNATVNNTTTTEIVVGSGGLLNATGTAFNSTIADSGTTLIAVNSGGHLQASSSSFALSYVDLNIGAVLNAGDLVGNAFNNPLYIPAIDVQYLSGPGSDNLQFQNINIQPDTLVSGQSVALNLIGTQNTTNLRYIFPGNFTVNLGATLTVPDGLNNDGTVLLQSANVYNSYTDKLALSGTFTNAPDGTIHAATGSGGARTITGTLVNQGQVSVDSNALLEISGTYNADGGSITGPGYLIGSKLVETDSPANHPDRRHRRHADDNQPAQHDFVGAGQRQVHLRQRHAGGGRRPEQRRHHPAGVLQPDRHRRRQRATSPPATTAESGAGTINAAGAKVRCLARPPLFPRQTCVHRST